MSQPSPQQPSFALDYWDLKIKINRLLHFAVKECRSGDHFQISIDWDSALAQKPIQVQLTLRQEEPENYSASQILERWDALGKYLGAEYVLTLQHLRQETGSVVGVFE